jgi:hypothetical protein
VGGIVAGRRVLFRESAAGRDRAFRGTHACASPDATNAGAATSAGGCAGSGSGRYRHRTISGYVRAGGEQRKGGRGFP